MDLNIKVNEEFIGKVVKKGKKMFSIGSKLQEDNLKIQGAKVKNTIISHNHILPKEKHQLVFQREKRRGKIVTLVGRFYLNDTQKKEILKLLKTKLATGGTINDVWIEIQGEKKDKIKNILINQGWKFK